MLDENLPVFFLRPSQSGITYHSTLNLSHRGSEPEPAYSLQYLDPQSTLQAHKNCYAAALFDAHNPDVLYGEVLVRPSWTQPTLSQEEIRRNGGVPPPPEPRVPTSFNIQLYNPDQQVTVQLKEGKWGSSDTFEFLIPEKTFRAPSASTLDRGQSDPGSLDITPRIRFTWKRESKLSKDLTCFMTGKSTDTEKKKSKRDPDIAVALWRSLREMTLYESNLSRIDTEDPKGLEVTLLLSAIVIKDLYFSPQQRFHDIFNIQGTTASRSRTSSQSRPPVLAASPPLRQASPAVTRRDDLPRLQTAPPAQLATHVPPPDPREQWQIEAETARLRQAADAEAREVAKRRREREKAEELESRRLQRIFAQERKDEKRRKEEVDKETERLRRIYGVAGQSLRPESEQPPRRSFQGTLQTVPQGRMSTSSRPDLGASDHIYDTAVMSGANPSAGPSLGRKKKSFFGLRSMGDDLAPPPNRLGKKQSTIW